jgi:hypothetical protein
MGRPSVPGSIVALGANGLGPVWDALYTALPYAQPVDIAVLPLRPTLAAVGPIMAVGVASGDARGEALWSGLRGGMSPFCFGSHPGEEVGGGTGPMQGN